MGRLGAIVEVTLKIKPQQAVRRKLQELDFDDFAAQVKSVQEGYKAALAAGDEAAAQRALFPLDETNGMWHYALREVWRVDFEHLDKEPLGVLLNLDAEDQLVQAMDGPSGPGIYSQSNRQPVPPNSRVTANPRRVGKEGLPHCVVVHCGDSPAPPRPTPSPPQVLGQLLRHHHARVCHPRQVRGVEELPVLLW